MSSLARWATGRTGRVGAVALDPTVMAWLEAVGVAPGERLVVLRRGAFGGPLHVRTASGGEFALCRSVADSISVEPAPDFVEHGDAASFPLAEAAELTAAE